MYTADAIKHYGSAAEVAKALEISRAAVSKWGDVIPESSAYKLQVVSHGALRVEPSLYDKYKQNS